MDIGAHKFLFFFLKQLLNRNENLTLNHKLSGMEKIFTTKYIRVEHVIMLKSDYNFTNRGKILVETA